MICVGVLLLGGFCGFMGLFLVTLISFGGFKGDSVLDARDFM